MTDILVDSNVPLDVATKDSRWSAWSADALEAAAEQGVLVINPLVYAEVSIGFRAIEALEVALLSKPSRRDALPYEAAFLGGKSFRDYPRRGGAKTSPLPDFYIGAHALLADGRTDCALRQSVTGIPRSAHGGAWSREFDACRRIRRC